MACTNSPLIPVFVFHNALCLMVHARKPIFECKIHQVRLSETCHRCVCKVVKNKVFVISGLVYILWHSYENTH